MSNLMNWYVHRIHLVLHAAYSRERIFWTLKLIMWTLMNKLNTNIFVNNLSTRMNFLSTVQKVNYVNTVSPEVFPRGISTSKSRSRCPLQPQTQIRDSLGQRTRRHTEKWRSRPFSEIRCHRTWYPKWAALHQKSNNGICGYVHIKKPTVSLVPERKFLHSQHLSNVSKHPNSSISHTSKKAKALHNTWSLDWLL